jgi:hypothetical protein
MTAASTKKPSGITTKTATETTVFMYLSSRGLRYVRAVIAKPNLTLMRISELICLKATAAQ